MTTSSSFHLFPLLPTELKIKIYRLALSPRTVPVRLKLDLDAWGWSTERDWWTCYSVIADGETSQAPLPTVLRACYEAWKELGCLYKGLSIDREVLETLFGAATPEKLRTNVPKEGGGGGGGGNDDTNSSMLDEAISLSDSHQLNDFEKHDDARLSTQKLVENLLSVQQESKRPPFNSERDILAWKNTRRWASCGEPQLLTLVHPLFLASCLSVRYVRIEYIPCMANLLEVLAFSVLDDRRALDGLDLSVRNPSDGRVLRFRLCRIPEHVKISGEKGMIGEVMGEGLAEDGVEAMVEQSRLVWFPWSQKNLNRQGEGEEAQDPLARRVFKAIASPPAPPAPDSVPHASSPIFNHLSSARVNTVNTAVLQVLSPSDPTTGPGASGSWARVKALADPSKVMYNYQFSDKPLYFGTGNLQADILLWCRALTLHGAGYPANLPFNIVGVPCHGFCDESIGMGG